MKANVAASRPVLITGGAGFIGTNVAERLLRDGRPVTIYDNLSRSGVEQNLAALLKRHPGGSVKVVEGDVADAPRLRSAVKDASAVYHFAAQVAVTTSLEDPIGDFDTNARGTLNLLEAVRAVDPSMPLLFTSTNKVYGDLKDVTVVEEASRYLAPAGSPAASGVDESRSVSFHSPYGCSKGAADQYFLDYTRTFGMNATVFRMSCIYGPHQFGTEDQGWIAHFIMQALQDLPVTIYGDGKQVRDILFVEDLVEAMVLAHRHIDRTRGVPFNIGGGPGNTISLLELAERIERLQGKPMLLRHAPWRTADQRYYVSDTRRFHTATGWEAKVGVKEGVERLFHWLRENRQPAPKAEKVLAYP